MKKKEEGMMCSCGHVSRLLYLIDGKILCYTCAKSKKEDKRSGASSE